MNEGLNTNRLRLFIMQLASTIETYPNEEDLLEKGSSALQELVSHDDWLPDEFAKPHPQHYAQYLLHADSLERFSVVSFVWGPGQKTPVHDHQVWGMIGMLRGAEIEQRFERLPADGRLQANGDPTRLEPGNVENVSPTIGDIHQVSNAYDDRVSISIHVYGANIGAVKRAVYSECGSKKSFVSGYLNSHLPNLWDLSN